MWFQGFYLSNFYILITIVLKVQKTKWKKQQQQKKQTGNSLSQWAMLMDIVFLAIGWYVHKLSSD